MRRPKRHVNVSDVAKRGFVLTTRDDRAPTYVRKGFHLVPCPGEAHDPGVGGMIDNCSICAPLWGEIAIPAWLADIHAFRDAVGAVRGLSRWLGYEKAR